MSRRGSRGAQAVSWQDVDAFLEMAAQALRARTQAAEELAAKLSATNQRLEKEIREKGQLSQQEASASEDSSFLALQVQALQHEKQQLRDKVQHLERERAFLRDEVQLLRNQLDAHGGDESPAAASALNHHLQEELIMERDRNAVLEDEALGLRVRLAALERANQAQHMALLSYLGERNERAAGQGEGGGSKFEGLSCEALSSLHICGSPVGHSDWGRQHASAASASAASEGGDLDSGSHGSCASPLGVLSFDGTGASEERLPSPAALPRAAAVGVGSEEEEE